MALELNLIKLLIVKRAKFRRQATERTDKPELASDHVNDETKPCLLRKLEAILGFTLHLSDRISRRQEIRVQVLAAVRTESQVTFLVRGLKRATEQLTP